MPHYGTHEISETAHDYCEKPFIEAWRFLSNTTINSAFVTGDRHRRHQYARRMAAVAPDRILHQSLLLRSIEQRPGLAGRASSRLVIGVRAGRRRSGDWPDGALRLRADSRA